MRIHRTTSRLIVTLLTLLLLSAAGCAQSEPPTSPTSGEESGAESPTSPTSELRLAPGLHELEDGGVQALGTLEWRDLEGGFWVIVGGTEADGNVGEAVAVIANSPEFQDELKPLEGKQVLVTGKKLEGASVRMAGPEIEIESVQEISDTPGIAE